MIGLEHWGNAGFALHPDDLRALSPAEMQQRAIEQLAMTRQYVPPLSSAFSEMMLYPPFVPFAPQGWADWYACGDELH